MIDKKRNPWDTRNSKKKSKVLNFFLVGTCNEVFKIFCMQLRMKGSKSDKY